MTNVIDDPLKRYGARDQQARDQLLETSEPEVPPRAGIASFINLPRCGAKTRGGKPCSRIGNSRNGRCHLHGGRAGGPSGARNGNYRHGNATKEAVAQRRAARKLLREAARMLRGDQ
jgi:hypothetical protein